MKNVHRLSLMVLTVLTAAFLAVDLPLMAQMGQQQQRQEQERQRQEEKRQEEKRQEEERQREEEQGSQQPPQRPQPQRPQQQPDLRVTQGGFLSSASLYPGDTVTFHAVVTNNGQAKAPRSQLIVRLLKDGNIGPQGAYSWGIGSVEAGESIAFQQEMLIPANSPANGTPTGPGTYTVRLTIDPSNFIAESNEGNNTFDIPQSLTVIQPQVAVSEAERQAEEAVAAWRAAILEAQRRSALAERGVTGDRLTNFANGNTQAPLHDGWVDIFEHIAQRYASAAEAWNEARFAGTAAWYALAAATPCLYTSPGSPLRNSLGPTLCPPSEEAP